MRPGLELLAVMLASLVTLSIPAGSDLDALIERYETARNKAGALRGKKQRLKRLINKEIRPALQAIAVHGDDASLVYLDGELSDPIPEIAESCARVVGKLDTLPSARMLMRSLRDRPARPMGYQNAVIEALARTKSSAVKAWLSDKAFPEPKPKKSKSSP